MVFLEWLTKAITWLLTWCHSHPYLAVIIFITLGASGRNARRDYIRKTIQEIKGTENRSNHLKQHREIFKNKKN